MIDHSHANSSHDNDVAVVGMAGRFPGAPNIEAYWDNLVRGIEGIEHFDPPDAGSVSATGEHEVRAAARLQDVEMFDAEFFGFSPKEAELIDPQQRLFLECVHEALERAGYDPDRYPGLIGIYAGMGTSTYLRHVLAATNRSDAAFGLQLLIGNDKDYLTTMVSYRLNLRGPSVAVQTACSTSLVAVHLACQALLDYECDIALAGGVSVRTPQPLSYRYHEGSILSADGRCRAFDRQASGTVFGNGVGAVVLRRFGDAVEAGDRIHAVIRGSAINNDGSGKVGYTAPSVRGQVTMMEAALARAGVEPRSIQYIEAHGTGTPLGDPIEFKALTEVHRAKSSAVGYCGLGSVKSSVGHLDAAAGVAGLIKTVFALERGTMPPTLHFREASPEIPLAGSPFYVVAAATPWTGPSPKLAAVSSLGIGGTNAHVVLQEAPPAWTSPPRRPWEIVTLSARTALALETMTENLTRFFESDAAAPLADVAFTSQVGRREFPLRQAFVLANSTPEPGHGIRTAVPQSGNCKSGAPSVLFVMERSGEAPNWIGSELVDGEPVLRDALEDCAERLTLHFGPDVRDVLLGRGASETVADRATRDREYGNAIRAASMYAMARLWTEWGVAPAAIVGDGLGECVAACLAGVYGLDDAFRLVRARATLDSTSPGAREALRSLLAGMALNRPAIAIRSSVTGKWLSDEEAVDPEYWVRQAAESSTYQGSADEWRQLPNPVLLDIGPHGVEHAGVPNATTRVTPFEPGTGTRAHRALLDALASLWTLGASVNWAQFRGDERRARATLPTYPFERKRFWIDATASASEETKPDEKKKRAPLDEWVYMPVWRQSAPASVLPRREPFASDRGWLIFADGWGLADDLAQGLRARGEFVVVVRSGEGFTQLGEDEYAIDPRQYADYERVCRRVKSDRPPHTIVYLWNVEADRFARNPRHRMPEGHSTFDQLMFLAQAAHAAGIGGFHLAMCATGLARVIPGDAVSPSFALAAGACRVMAQEYPGVTSRWIDLRLPRSAGKRWRLANLLLEELACQSPAQAIAYRGNQRWIEGFEQVVLPRGTPVFREGGVYLIAGGAGALGLLLARHLGTAYRARLVLAARTAVPARDERATWLSAHDSNDHTSVIIRTMADIESAGGEVLTCAADVTRRDDVDRAFDEAEARFGRVDGVFHLAGVPAGGVMQLKTTEMVSNVCAPKVQGTRHLVDAACERGASFVALFSSIVGVMGGIGQSDYCAASAFMDAAAVAFSERGKLPVVTIDWDAWQADRWQERTLTQLPELREQFKRWRAEFGIRAEEGLEVLERVLGSGLRRVVVSPRDVSEAIAAHDMMARSVVGQERRTDTPTAPATGADLSATEERVIAIWRDVLGVTAPDPNASFLDLGGHSLMMLQVVARLKQEFQIEVSVRALFDNPTAAGLAAFLDGLLRMPQASEDADEPNDLARLLAEVEQLTPEEVSAELSAIEGEIADGVRP